MASTATAVRFPSVEWFQAAADIYNQNLEYVRRNGQTDCSMAIVFPDQIIKLTFIAYTVSEVRQISEAELPAVDFFLQIDLDTWKEMVKDIKRAGRAEGKYTLNTLDGLDPNGIARSKAGYIDGDATDAFYRFNQSFQDFFDLSHKLDTTF